MGCCCRIFTEQILANYFNKMRDSREVSLDELKSYLDYISERFPVYVTSDFDADRIEDCVEMYPKLYSLVEHEDKSIGVRRGELKPKLEYFNACFCKDYSDYIERLTQRFIDEEVPK